MNHKHWLGAALIALGFSAGVLIAEAQGPQPRAPRAVTALAGTAFTYQGQLKNGGALVNGTCDFQFGLWDAASSGLIILGTLTQTVSSVIVTNGLFTATLDFGVTAFNGEARWLATAVRCPASSGSYTALSPRQQITPAPYALALPGLRTEQNVNSPNVIGGWYQNSVTSGAYGAFIGGGSESANYHIVTDNFGTIGGGRSNQAGNGSLSTTDAKYATVGGGNSNEASGEASTVGGGFINTASITGTTIGGGYNNKASAEYATVPGGFYGSATHYGEMTHASGRFTTFGDAQTSVYILRRSTTNATQAEIFLDGATVSQRITLALTRTMTFEILLVARSDAGSSAGYRFIGVIKNVGGTTSFVGTPNKVILDEDDTTWDADVFADDTNDALVVKVTGAASTNIRWVARVETAEVLY